MITLLYDDGIATDLCPSSQSIAALLTSACAHLTLADDIELCIRFATDEAVLALNTQWRNKPSCTDVLSFPQQDGPNFVLHEPLGDIVLAVCFVQQEAKRLALTPIQHSLHLILHGFLHLLAYDHQEDTEAAHMQRLECLIMHQANLHCPYPELADG